MNWCEVTDFVPSKIIVNIVQHGLCYLWLNFSEDTLCPWSQTLSNTRPLIWRMRIPGQLISLHVES